MRVTSTEEGKFPHLFVAYLTSTCFHCNNPVCMEACPVEAITKRNEDGIVVLDQETCVGEEACGGLCKEACPYDSPQFGDEENAKMQKCDLCLERWQENKKPVCVEACPMRALDAGPLEELKARYGDTREAAGFVYSPEVGPSVIFKQKTPSEKDNTPMERNSSIVSKP
jgi:anaerobic dimethyl sulfoxide reductase subunit B (iron-sulfur subunit)